MAVMLEPLNSWSWESSEVDWCERNFETTEFVAEFWNTVSNILFFIIPPLLIYLFRQYAQQVTWGVNVVWLLLVVVGVGSVYFHATLSLVGQLMDEIAIIWVVFAALSIWYPKRYMPLIFNKSRKNFQIFIAIVATLSTALACVMPEINCVVLFILGVPATALLVVHMRSCTNQRVYHLGLRCSLMWVMALSSWVSDNLFCKSLERIGFPYMHCFWHVFILLASYQACVIFAYFDALSEVPEQLPVLRYWPQDSWGWLGIPHVILKCGGSKPTHKMY